ncbi:hypothetical protein KKA03_04020, partial [archaeon]|nr:hypothetical protein [archaeon]
MRKTFLFAGLVLLTVAILAGCTGPKETAAPATAAPTTAPVALPTYSGTLYVAGHGGHFAVAKVAIDPSDTTNPITVKKLSKIDLAPLETSPSTHKTHDARIDYGTDNLYWSTYMPDTLTEEGKSLLH